MYISKEKCRGKCAFCPQSTGESDRISRIDWPKFMLEDVANALKRRTFMRRICLQLADEPRIAMEAEAVVERLSFAGMPVSVSAPPMSIEEMAGLKRAGVEILTIPVDCADVENYRSIKGRALEEVLGALSDAVKVFGRGRVGTHIIIGLGETEKEGVEMIHKAYKIGAVPSLFAFTPVRGTPMACAKRPTIGHYRRIQIARRLIVEGGLSPSDFEFGKKGEIVGFKCPSNLLESAVRDPGTFMVRGCPSCNRPYFNEAVSGPFYNFPSEPAMERVLQELWSD